MTTNVYQIWSAISSLPLTVYTKLDHPYTLSERSRWLLMGDMISLREEMDRETVGIAGWDMRKGWNIYPFDHEMAGE